MVDAEVGDVQKAVPALFIPRRVARVEAVQFTGTTESQDTIIDWAHASGFGNVVRDFKPASWNDAEPTRVLRVDEHDWVRPGFWVVKYESESGEWLLKVLTEDEFNFQYVAEGVGA